MQKQHDRNPLRSSLALAGSAAMLAVGASGAPQSVIDTFAVSVKTDAMNDVPFPTVYVGQFGLASQLLGSWEGDTDPIDNVGEYPSVIRLDETVISSSGGSVTETTIGQHFTFTADAGNGADGVRLNYFQPTARRVSFYPPYAVNDRISGWYASGSETASYGFEALVAELPTREVISNYMAYTIGMHVEVFMHGLLIRCDDWTDLGAEGINICIDREGYDYGVAGPQIFTFGVSNPNYASLLTTQLKGLDAGTVDFQLFGYLSPGDNLILFTDPNPGGLYPADPLGSIVAAFGGGNDCTLPDPPCKTDGTCNPPLARNAVMGGAINCTEKWLKLGPPMKPSCGSSAGFNVCTTHKGGVSWKVKVGVPEVVEFEIGADGEVSGTHCQNVSANGGWKVQAYQCYKICVRMWDCTRTPWYSIFPVDYHDTTSCVVPGGIATATCQFQVCGGN